MMAKYCSRKCIVSLYSKFSALYVIVALIAFYTTYIVFDYVHTQTYEWQCTYLAEKVTPVSRQSCSLPVIPPSSDGSKKKPKIAMLMMYDNADGNWNKDLMERVLDNRNAYAKQYGYTVINANDLIDKSRPAAWSKLIAMETHLASNKFDYILYIDMDVIIMNPSIQLESFIVPGKDLTMTQDWNGLNSGVWLAKNSEWTRWFLHTAWEQKQLVQKKSPEGISYPFEYEQRAFHFLTNSDIWQQRHLPHYRGDIEDIKSHIFTLPQCALNSYVLHPLDYRGSREESQYVEGDFLVHFAGKKGQMKTDLMEHYLREVEESN